MADPRVYLAGPEVFHPEAAGLGAAKMELCRAYGFVGQYPFQAEVHDSRTIYRSCLALMRESDLGIFNLTPFLGPSADVGTVFELGVMVGEGKPVFAYTNVADDLLARLRRDQGASFDEAAACWRDRFGMSMEDFGNADNLMLDEAVAAQGVPICRRAVPPDRRFTDLEAFTTSLVAARAALTRAPPL